MSDDYPYQAEVTCPSFSFNPSCRRHGGCGLSREAMRMTERELQHGAGPIVTGRWEALMDQRPAAATGRCTCCGRPPGQTPSRENWRVSERERAVRTEIEVLSEIEENQ
jgi:hypothetical protein